MRVPLAAVAAALLAAGSGAGGGEPLLVAAPTAELRAKPGGKGAATAILHQGTRVLLAGKKKGKAVAAETVEPFAVKGWVARDALGCRMSADTPLAPAAGGGAAAAAAGSAPVAHRGAMVRLLGEKEGWLQVETAPYDVRVFKSAEESGGDTPTFETVWTGYIATGWVPRGACTAGEKPYFDSAPEEGMLLSFTEDSTLYADPFAAAGGAGTKKEGPAPLPGKALRLTRWVSLEEKEGWSRGRTDGPVALSGWARKETLGPAPNTNPLNIIFITPVRQYEVLVESELRSLDGAAVVATLPGGIEVAQTGMDEAGCIVETLPPIVVTGAVDCAVLRDLGLTPEMAIDGAKQGKGKPGEGGKKPGGTVAGPERGPKGISKKPSQK